MPRRSIRVAAAAFCLASLLLCFGVAWMSRGAGRRVGVYTPFGRWSVLAAGGRVTLFRPLPCCPPSRLAWVRQRVEAAGSLRNEDVRWLVGSVRQDKWVESPNALPFGTGSAVTPFADTSLGAEVNRPLLEALEDPAAFAAAHVALSLHLDRVTDTWDVQGSGRSVVANFNRLPVELKPDADAGIPPDRMVYRDAAAAPVDPAQLPAIRDYWHARTSRPVASLPRGLLLAATAAPPLLWLLPRAARAGGRVRRRLGRPELGTPRQQVGRWLFVAAAAFSELVLVAVVALWVRSWRVADWWTASHESSAGLTCLASERGKLLVFRQRSRREDTGPVTWTFESGGFRGFTLPPDAKGAGDRRPAPRNLGRSG